jgi:N-acetylglucosamine-6-phosphate deacetylase
VEGVKIPGLVDLQVNGYEGVDFSGANLTREDFIRACRRLLEAGTTAFLPIMITSPQEVYKHNLEIMASVLELKEFHGRLLGVHLEGPFISPEEGACGAHNPQWIIKPDIKYLEQLIDWAGGKVKLLTIAAELKGAEQLASYAVSRGIAVSLGHQMANEKDLGKLVRAGAVLLTHLGNGVPMTLHRHHNPIWTALAEDGLVATIITDGHHLPPSVIKTIIRTKGPQRCIVISDASSLAGLPAGRYETLGHKVILEGTGRLYDPATGYMVGSSATMLQCMNYLASLNLVSIDELIAMGFYNPLKLIGLSPKDVAQGPDIWFNESQQVFYLEK